MLRPPAQTRTCAGTPPIAVRVRLTVRSHAVVRAVHRHDDRLVLTERAGDALTRMMRVRTRAACRARAAAVTRTHRQTPLSRKTRLSQLIRSMLPPTSPISGEINTTPPTPSQAASGTIVSVYNEDMETYFPARRPGDAVRGAVAPVGQHQWEPYQYMRQRTSDIADGTHTGRACGRVRPRRPPTRVHGRSAGSQNQRA